MPTTPAPWSLPYPTNQDLVGVPEDIRELAEATAARFGLTDRRAQVTRMLTVPVSGQVPATLATVMDGPSPGNTQGLHGAFTITRPFGAGVSFRGFIIAKAYGVLTGECEIELRATNTTAADAAAVREMAPASHTRSVTLLTEVYPFDSGASDTYAYQPVLTLIGSGAGRFTPVVDARLSKSRWLAWPRE